MRRVLGSSDQMLRVLQIGVLAPNIFIEYLIYFYLKLITYSPYLTFIDIELAIIVYSNCFYPI